MTHRPADDGSVEVSGPSRGNHMARLLWTLAFVLTFLLGLAAAGIVRSFPAAVQEIERLRATVRRLEQQVGVLQGRLRARESVARARAEVDSDGTRRPSAGPGGPRDRIAATFLEGRADPSGRGRGEAGRQGLAADGSRQPGSTASTKPPATVEAALDRFYKYLEAASGTEGRERWRHMREMVEELRAMGDAGAQALVHVLQSGADSEERRAAARLLGQLQAPQALPALRDVIEREEDVLLRRAAAQGLRRLQVPESLPVMERILANPGEDRFVRLSAAYGLAESGRAIGVTGLTQIFEEATADGRGRDLAFRALIALKDERPLPFMRALVTAPVEPGYRLQAMRYLAAQGDRQALAALQMVMQSSTEQPSLRDAAAQAHAAISGR